MIEHTRYSITEAQFREFDAGDVIIIAAPIGKDGDSWYLKLATDDQHYTFDCVVNAQGRIIHFTRMDGFRLP